MASPQRDPLFHVFNLLASESVLLLDCTGRPPAPGFTVLDPSLPLPQAAKEAVARAIDDFGPEDTSVAVVLEGAGDSSDRCAQLKQWLLQEGGCLRVLRASREQLAGRYGFLFEAAPLTIYPNEIVDGQLFLGSAGTVNEQAMRDLHISHVVSVVDGKRPPVFGRQQLWCPIPDEETAPLAPVLREALPFIDQAIRGGGRVLVHCARGQSRSASVVIAHLMETCRWSLDEALAVVVAQRRSVQPNAGFLRQLRRNTWSLEGPAARLPEEASQHDLSPQALDSLILKDFGRDSQRPEHHGVKSSTMGEWLDPHFDASRITCRELQHGLGVVLEGVLTRQECLRVIQETEKLGYGRTGYMQEYRGNRRLMVHDVRGAMAEGLWQRICRYVPKEILADWLPQDGDYPSGAWLPSGCNSRFRFSKYFPGQQFQCHKDDLVTFGCDRCTLMTVNIYLNDLLPEQAGRTRFFLERGGEAVDMAGGLAGSLVIFRQELVLHDGEVLASGLKYLMRTDVVCDAGPQA